MKKYCLYILSIGVLAILFITFCTKKNVSKDQPVTTLSHYETIKSQKAYDRGYAEGKRVAMMKEGYEREKALIELHSLISSLERNGFPQTASDFSKGVQAAFADN